MSDNEQEVVTCVNCNTELNIDDALLAESQEYICNECSVICDSCDSIYTQDMDTHYVDGEIWCRHCTENDAYWCESCNEYNSDGSYYVRDRGEYWCDSCTNNYSVYCEDCGNYYVDGCDSCVDERYIHDWSYKPDPIFHCVDNNERLFFGVELEMEARNGTDLMAGSEYAYQLEKADLAYLKNDGSLNQGMELVTHPMSYDFYKEHATTLWTVIETLRTKYEMRSGDTSTCGIHVHISRSGFSGGAHMHRFLNLVYSNERLFSKLAGRHSDRWAKFNDVQRWDEHGNGFRAFKSKLESGRNSDRYSAVNTQNSQTLEMRIFKGSMRKDTILAHVGLAHASVEYTRGLSVRDIANGALQPDRFIAYIREHADMYPETIARMEGRIQISESV